MTAIQILTPIKNEADNLPRLFNSVRTQSIQPQAWVLVDDGSTDGSTDLIREFTSEVPWAEYVSSGITKQYDIGAHYARVLRTGYESLRNMTTETPEYYMVLDGDMTLTEGYLAALSSFLNEQPAAAIASGPVFVRRQDGELELEQRLPTEPAGGATLYDGSFYRGIGGPPETPCVDSVTKAKARLRGFNCRHVTDLGERAIQARPTSGETSRARQLGVDNYVLGYHPLFALVKAASMSVRGPRKSGLKYIRGYATAVLGSHSRIADEDVRRYFRREKPLRLLNRAREQLL